MKSVTATKQELQTILAGFQKALDACPKGESPSLLLTMHRDDACTFAQSFRSDATLSRVSDMQDINQIGALTLAHVASDLIKALPDEEEVELDIPSSLEKTELGTLFAFVLMKMVDLAKNNPSLYREPIRLK